MNYHNTIATILVKDSNAVCRKLPVEIMEVYIFNKKNKNNRIHQYMLIFIIQYYGMSFGNCLILTITPDFKATNYMITV